MLRYNRQKIGSDPDRIFSGNFDGRAEIYMGILGELVFRIYQEKE